MSFKDFYNDKLDEAKKLPMDANIKQSLKELLNKDGLNFKKKVADVEKLLKMKEVEPGKIEKLIFDLEDTKRFMTSHIAGLKKDLQTLEK